MICHLVCVSFLTLSLTSPVLAHASTPEFLKSVLQTKFLVSNDLAI